MWRPKSSFRMCNMVLGVKFISQYRIFRFCAGLHIILAQTAFADWFIYIKCGWPDLTFSSSVLVSFHHIIVQNNFSSIPTDFKVSMNPN